MDAKLNLKKVLWRSLDVNINTLPIRPSALFLVMVSPYIKTNE